MLDYNHDNDSWEPNPPAEFTRFYRAFLDWRRMNRWNNRMADCLPELFQSQGIHCVLVNANDETVRRGDPDFSAAAAIWIHVVETIGPQLVTAGVLNDQERIQAECVYRDWVHESLQTQTLQMRTVEGRVP